MNVYGIGAAAAPVLRPQEAQRTGHEPERVAPAALSSAASVRGSAGGLLAPREPAIPLDAPAGTDPELWKVLTAEERSFFMRMSSAGPLTYGPQLHVDSSPALPVRGGRLDVLA
jgi:hypothetical protein